MSFDGPYTLHKETEQMHQDLLTCLGKQDYPNADEIRAESLNRTRKVQLMDAKCALTGSTLIISRDGLLLAKIAQCHFEYSTATVCFAVRGEVAEGVMVGYFEVTPDMDIEIEKATP